MPIEVYCKYCKSVIMRFRKILTFNEIYKRVQTAYNGRCPYCNRHFSRIDYEHVEYSVRVRSRKSRKVSAKI